MSDDVEKLRIKYGFYKFLLGTFAISLLSVIINWQIQTKRLQFEIQTKESDYIAQFLEHGLRKELEQRRDFAAYFVRLSPSEEARTRWNKYLEFVESLISKAKETEKQIAEKDLKLAATVDKIVELEFEAGRTSTEIDKSIEPGGKDEKDAEKDSSEQQAKASELHAEAERLSAEFVALQNQLVEQRLELASLRSKPLEPKVLAREALQRPKTVPSAFGWVYLGHYDSDKDTWKTRYFEFDSAIHPDNLKGNLLFVREETGSVHVRNSPPNPFGKFGDVVGYLRPAQKIKVLEVKEWFNTGYIWAQVASPG